MKQHTYVPCKWCTDTQRADCRACDGRGEVIDPLDQLCNLCGETMCPIGTMNEQHPHGLYKATVTGGYDSVHLLDLNKYTFSLCEFCLRKLFMQCKIKPDIEDAIHGPSKNYSFEDDQKYYEYKEWRRLGGFHQAYLSRKCNTAMDCPNTALYTVLFSDEFSEDCCCEDHKDDWKNTFNARLVKFIPNVLKPFL